MIIALTGTPGTGKTSVAENLGYDTVDITAFVEQEGLGEKVGGEYEVRVDELVEALKTEIDTAGDVLVEGHLAHHVPADLCIVLRCRPDELRDRLSNRNYSESKVRENVEAEAMDFILSEAVDKQEQIIEVDTTGKSSEESAEEVKRMIREEDTGYGNVDWSEFL